MSEFPIYNESDETGDLGVDLVSTTIKKEFSWIFREQVKNDLGLDAYIEIIDDSRQGTGRVLAAQIKSGPSYFSEEHENGYIFRGEKKHLNYWLNHSLPVIIILCDLEASTCRWVEVNRSNTTELDVGWKIVVPKSQYLEILQKEKLIQIAGRPQHPDIVELLVFKFLQGKYHKHSKNRIDICPLMMEPRDFHYYTCLADIEHYEGCVYVAHHYDLYQPLSIEDIQKFIQWRSLNMGSCGHNYPMPNILILVISENKEKLILSAEINELINKTKKVELLRLIYHHSPSLDGGRFLSLTELDENDEEIYFY